MIKEQFFPTTIYGKDIKLDNELFEKEIIEWSKKDAAVKKTNMHGWHSKNLDASNNEFQPVINELYKMQKEM